MKRALRSRASLLVLAVLSLSALAVVAPAPAGAVTAGPTASTVALSPSESAYLSRINGLRQSLGLTVLVPDPNLTALARAHSAEMAAAQNLFHTPDLTAGVTTDWELLGENVGVGDDVERVWNAFVASPPHYANLVEPGFTLVGVGVVEDGPIHWTTHRFLDVAPPPAPRPTVPPAPAPVVTAPPATPPPPPPVTAPRPSSTVRPVPTTIPTTAPTTAPTTTTPPPPPAPRGQPQRVAVVLDAMRPLL